MILCHIRISPLPPRRYNCRGPRSRCARAKDALSEPLRRNGRNAPARPEVLASRFVRPGEESDWGYAWDDHDAAAPPTRGRAVDAAAATAAAIAAALDADDPSLRRCGRAMPRVAVRIGCLDRWSSHSHFHAADDPPRCAGVVGRRGRCSSPTLAASARSSPTTSATSSSTTAAAAAATRGGGATTRSRARA